MVIGGRGLAGEKEKVNTGAGRRRTVQMECLESDESSQMGHRKDWEDKCTEEKESKVGKSRIRQ